MAEDSVERQLRELLDRISRIESHLGIATPETEKEAPTSESRIEEAPSGGEPAPVEAVNDAPKAAAMQRLLLRREDAPAKPVEHEEHITAATSAKEPTTQPSLPPSSPPSVPPTAPSTVAARPISTKKRAVSPSDPETADARRLEALIGGTWAAWVGAIVVVIAMGFLAKVAYDAGLFGRLSPAARCLSIAAFGLALIAGGEFAHRRIGVKGSIALFASGLGTLFVAAYASFGWFGLFAENGAFLLMALVAIGGMGLTLRANSVSIGVLALLGGYLTPLLLSGSEGPIAVLPIYLSALLGMGLALSCLRPKPFRLLRPIVMSFHAVLGVAWLTTLSPAEWMWFIAFGAVWWAMVLGECTWAAMREQSPIGNPVAVFLATAWYVCFSAIMMGPIAGVSTWTSGGFMFCLAVLSGAVALQIGSGLDGLRSPGRLAADRLAVVLWIIVGMLVPISGAIMLGGYGRVICFLLIGLGGVEAGRRLPSRGVDVFGVAVMCFGVLLAFGQFLLGLGGFISMRHDFGIIAFSDWSILMAATSAALIVQGARFRVPVGGGAWSAVPIALGAAGLGVWVLSISVDQLHADGLTLAWLLPGIVLLGMHPWVRSLQPSLLVVMLVVIASAKWVAIDAFIEANRSAMPFLNLHAVTGIFLAGLFWWAERIDASGPQTLSRPRIPRARTRRDWAPVVVGVGLLWLLGFEIDRTLLALGWDRGISTWPYGVHLAAFIGVMAAFGGAVMLYIGNRRQHVPMRLTGIALVVLTGFLWLPGALTAAIVIPHDLNATPILNPIFLSGAGILVATIVTLLHAPSAEDLPVEIGQVSPSTLLRITAALLGITIGSIEIMQSFGAQDGENTVRHVVLSLFWGVYAMGLLATGFWRRAATIRYAGLALLGITLFKVASIDTAQLGSIERPISWMVIGLFLVATSVAYAKLSPKLLEHLHEAEPVQSSEPLAPKDDHAQDGGP